MKNVFIQLTEHRDYKDDRNEVWINMSRCQEIRHWKLGSRLTMNIPDYEVFVKEPPRMVLEKLAAVNMEEITDSCGPSVQDIASPGLKSGFVE